MFKKITLGTVAALAMLSAAPAAAQSYGYSNGYYSNSGHARGYEGRYEGRSRYDGRAYANRYSSDRCRSGTTGAIVGGAGGALLGREIAGRGDRTLGAIIGGVAGALGGRAVTRDSNCR